MSPVSLFSSPTSLMAGRQVLRRARFWRHEQLVGETYRANLLRYWPILETAGTTVYDRSNNRGNAVSSGLTLKQVGIGDGHQCPQFNPAYVNIYSAAFNTIFPRQAATISIWAKVLNAAVWTDGTQRRLLAILEDANNFLHLRRTTVNNQIGLQYRANGAATISINSTDYAIANWLHIAMTFSVSADSVTLYLNGNLISTAGTIGGAWPGALSNTSCVIGGANTVPNNPWSGYLAHAALWNVALPAQAVKRLSRF